MQLTRLLSIFAFGRCMKVRLVSSSDLSVREQWLDQSALQSQGLIFNGTSVELGSSIASQNIPYTACLATPLYSDSQTVWQLKVEKRPEGSSISFGVSQKDLMQPGWKMGGLFYNGNLHDGGGALKTNFGPYLQEDDTIKMLVEISDEATNSLNVYYKFNDGSLGSAFSLQPIGVPPPLYTCVSLTGTGTKVDIDKISNENISEFYIADANPYKFSLLDSDVLNVKGINHENLRSVSLTFAPAEQYAVFKAAGGNSISSGVESAEERVLLKAPVRTTLMAPSSEDVASWEEMLKKCLDENPNIKFTEDESGLSIQCSDGELQFGPYTAVSSPVTSVPKFRLQGITA